MPTRQSKDRDSYKDLARMFKALGNEARLLIVQRLMDGEMTVGEITKIVGLDQSTVSKHLSVLRTGGLVEDRRDANMVYYRLLTPCIGNFFSCAARVQKEKRSD
jgi:DNA-binding transcriptional ArsR family regulator